MCKYLHTSVGVPVPKPEISAVQGLVAGLLIVDVRGQAQSQPNQSEANAMKATWFLLCFLGATAALGQSFSVAALSSVEPQPLQMASHPAHASQHPMETEQNLIGNSAYVYAQGERPLWEVAPVTVSVPLGDVARALRQEHLTAKKAD